MSGVVKGWDQSPVWGDSQYPDVSSDGRWIAFTSAASNLVPGDTNGVLDAFLVDRDLTAFSRISVSSAGIQGNGHSGGPVISRDNRFIAFGSISTNLDPADTDVVADIYLRDLQQGTTILVSKRLGSGSSLWGTLAPSISGDGRYVAYPCGDDNVIPGDSNNAWDIFVYDRVLDTTELVSVGPGGIPADAHSFHPTLSADGRFVAFQCEANNWFPKKTPFEPGVYIRDRQLGTITPVSQIPSGLVVRGTDPVLSEDGRWIAFLSNEALLAPGHPAGLADVFVWDRKSGNLEWVSANQAGSSTYHSANPDLSADGRFVVWDGWADDVAVPGGLPSNQGKVFLHDRATATTSLVSQAAGGGLPDGSSLSPSISADGRVVAFWSYGSTLVPATPLYTWHVFWRACDVASPQTYCAARASSVGCRPTLRASGTPSASAGSGFKLRAELLPSATVGTIAYGLAGPQGVPMANGWLCVAPPLRRLPAKPTGGAATPSCQGTLEVDFNAWIASGLDPALGAGQPVHAQAWVRDPKGAGLALTDAVAFLIEP